MPGAFDDPTAAVQPVVILIDDSRAFRDGRPCYIARSSADAVALLLSLKSRRIDHLWLDHDLGGDDTVWPVVRLLEDSHLAGDRFDIDVVHIQASRSGPAHQLGMSMRRLGYVTDRPYDVRSIFTRWNGDPESDLRCRPATRRPHGPDTTGTAR